jgi:hypothetical protein
MSASAGLRTWLRDEQERTDLIDRGRAKEPLELD